MPKGEGKIKVRMPMDEDAIDALFRGSTNGSVDGGFPIDGGSADPQEPVYDIDIEKIEQDANVIATSTILNLSRMYSDKQFLEDHPDFKHRLDNEIESLKNTYAMLKADKIVHENLLKAISFNPNNGTMYMSLVKLQNTMIQLQTKADQTLDRIRDLQKGFQTQLDFNEQKAEEKRQESQDSDVEVDPENVGAVTSRGSKEFMEKLANVTETEDLDSQIKGESFNILHQDLQPGDQYDLFQ